MQIILKMTEAQKGIQQEDFKQAEAKQQEAKEALRSAQARLRDLYEDETALPLQRLKQVKEATDQLAKQVDEMKKKVSQTESQQQAQARSASSFPMGRRPSPTTSRVWKVPLEP